MNAEHGRVCPVERAGRLDNIWRKWLQDPYKILKPHIREGMTALDVGCGPGFFTIPMAHLVGENGQVVAADIQAGMLDRLRMKIAGTALETRITLHRCDVSSIGFSESVDFVLLFYVVHEVPDKVVFFREIAQLLRRTGHMLFVEPSFHVSHSDFERTLLSARAAGLADRRGPKVFLSKTAILEKGLQENLAVAERLRR
ncbi:MAG: class I SAM-dependent methyltransferase [Candidatus Krumholzibacteria bacterium]|nr:class I SAM-dependent methyltransferase [Candidatus Krumholzibacteria bacterium]